MAKEYNKVEQKIVEPVQEAVEGEVIEKKQIKAVVKTKPKKYKKGLTERLVVALLGPDGIKAIGHKLNQDIVVPAIKNIVVDSITSGIQMAIFGREERNGSAPRSYNGPSSRYWQSGQTGRPGPGPTNYQSRYQTQSAPPRMETRGNRVPEYILGTREEALNVLDGLNEILLDFGLVTAADYYDLIGMDTEYTDNQWGWTDLRFAKIRSVRGGYVIDFPGLEVVG